MKTVKDVAAITGVSIRTLRYYDEIGLLKPAKVTEAGYRLYDSKAIERLQEILFFKELEIPLENIRKIMEHPAYDKEQALFTQKALLEQKRNRLNGIIELIPDVMKGINTMSFEAFNEKELQEILDHTLECMPKETLKFTSNLWRQKKRTMNTQQQKPSSALPKIIRKCSALTMQGIYFWIWQMNI